MPNRVVIYGGRGGLGSTLVKSFKSKGKTVAGKIQVENLDESNTILRIETNVSLVNFKVGGYARLIWPQMMKLMSMYW